MEEGFGYHVVMRDILLGVLLFWIVIEIQGFLDRSNYISECSTFGSGFVTNFGGEAFKIIFETAI
ncbi:hypothetical protein [Methanonatronarchaeum thermophilum]|uniref:hypothetical protein n=1 Tax=Methanonatronarchaeum thermophilum TaxID=1927129 RepID=UPI00117AE563|nr:hypothetical protein [Methanonatronarchaeum thermophilum]